MPQQYSFTCVIDDWVLHDRFSASVQVLKRDVIQKSRDGTQIEIADVYITPISGQHAFYQSKFTWERTPAKFNVPTKDKSGSHNHFIVTNSDGQGLYVVRDAMRREVHRRHCSVWDLGRPFASGVIRVLRDFA
jgi:hypothetical protein